MALPRPDANTPSGWTALHYTDKKIYVSGGAMEVEYKNAVTSTTSGSATWNPKKVRIYIPAPGGNVGSVELRPDATAATDYKRLVYHYDHLGSIQAITDYGESRQTWETLNPIDASGKQSIYSYDAWGQRRDVNDWKSYPWGQSQTLPLCTWGWDNPTTTAANQDEDDLIPCGFTGHEMLDDLGLVHMNGRIYDARLSRFLSADLLVQAPMNLQSYNRYSYCMNNPTGYVDPSGYLVRINVSWLDEVNDEKERNRLAQAAANNFQKSLSKDTQKQLLALHQSNDIIVTINIPAASTPSEGGGASHPNLNASGNENDSECACVNEVNESSVAQMSIATIDPKMNTSSKPDNSLQTGGATTFNINININNDSIRISSGAASLVAKGREEIVNAREDDEENHQDDMSAFWRGATSRINDDNSMMSKKEAIKLFVTLASDMQEIADDSHKFWDTAESFSLNDTKFQGKEAHVGGAEQAGTMVIIHRKGVQKNEEVLRFRSELEKRGRR